MEGIETIFTTNNMLNNVAFIKQIQRCLREENTEQERKTLSELPNVAMHHAMLEYAFSSVTRDCS